ncbi:MAG: hypothetical protein AB8H79_04935 [Myxococcota bacterium]
MKWEVAENCRVDIVGYSGINYSGDRFETRIFPSGRQGDDLPGDRIRSMAILGPVGARVLLRTTLQDDWEEHTWRVITITEDKVFHVDDGRIGVRIPDLDWMTKPDAFRHNSDVEVSYPLANTVAEGKTWTFGRRGARDLKRGIVMICVDKVE